jgi:hypothetical protein
MIYVYEIYKPYANPSPRGLNEEPLDLKIFPVLEIGF